MHLSPTVLPEHCSVNLVSATYMHTHTYTHTYTGAGHTQSRESSLVWPLSTRHSYANPFF